MSPVSRHKEFCGLETKTAKANIKTWTMYMRCFFIWSVGRRKKLHIKDKEKKCTTSDMQQGNPKGL